MAMSVTEQELIEIIPEVAEYSWIFYTTPDNFQDMLENYATSQLWRLNNLYTIVDKNGNLVPFVMNRAQLLVYAKIINHGRVIILKSRQQGISTFYLIYYFDNAMHIPHRTVGMQAQGREESKTLLERVIRLWTHLDVNYKLHALGNITRVKNSSFEQAFSNDSTIYIRTSFRSATLHDLHVSEFGKIAHKYPDKAEEIISGSMEACAPRPGNNIAIESTAEGEDKFKHMWDEAWDLDPSLRSAEDFSPIFLPWHEDPDCINLTYQEPTPTLEKYFDRHKITDIKKRNFYVAKQRRLKSRMTKEYPTTPEEAFQAALELSYYGALYQDLVEEGRLRSGVYEPSLPVYAATDLGINDLFTIIYFQELESDDDFRIIGEDYGRDEAIPYYADMMRRHDWEIDLLYLPHDATVRSLNDKKTRATAFKEEGFRVKVVKRSSVIDGIDRVRSYIPKMLIDTSCTMVQKTMVNYVKEFDEKTQLTKATPVHNFWSHMADAIRVGIMGSKGIHKRKVINTSDKSNKAYQRRRATRSRRKKYKRVGGI
jgi:hypothetical protein